jgi:hypothetical protein
MEFSSLFSTDAISPRVSYRSHLMDVEFYLKEEYRGRLMIPTFANRTALTDATCRAVISAESSTSFTPLRFKKAMNRWDYLTNLHTGGKTYLLTRGLILEFNTETYHHKVLLAYKLREGVAYDRTLHMGGQAARSNVMNGIEEVMVDHREITNNHPKLAKILPDIYSAAVNADKKVVLYNNLDAMLCDRFEMPNFATLAQRNNYILDSAALLLQ